MSEWTLPLGAALASASVAVLLLHEVGRLRDDSTVRPRRLAVAGGGLVLAFLGIVVVRFVDLL